ncbi:type VI secretion system protein IglI family protein [Stigmatella sp. ncwal1]|uniref:Type VI secretion system protein IglI family protein n=1 Tax=Stigmatella ashevillensis TaxID=2995309 RepID=A0ABT5DMJ3_9BACT|nr:type VI secretion system protein IglI family protein [Stigmatella ashevillena]MDC0713582.1 type VI secretion system protein IglI family protein [Stigmatella ashevillena]
MGEPAKVAAVPLERGLLNTALEAEAPDLESSDERLEKVNGLVSRSDYLGAARAAEALLREGLYDVRLVGPYVLGLFIEGGLQALPAMFHSLSSTLLRNWQFFGPSERRDMYADGSLRWLLKVLNKHIEHHERIKDETWQRWVAPSNREPLEQALALSEEIFSSFGQAMPRNGCEAPFRRLTQWMEGHLMSLPSAQPPAAPEPEVESARESERAAVPEREGPPRAAAREAGPTVPVSPALAELMRKLAAFDTLVQRQDFQRASVVAADVLAVMERFDPRVYLPSLFSRFFSGLSTHAEQVESLLQGTESLSFRALDQLYRVDLETFLASGDGSSGAEE